MVQSAIIHHRNNVWRNLIQRIVASQSKFLFYTLKQLSRIEEIILVKASKADGLFYSHISFDLLELVRRIFSVGNGVNI